MLMAVWGGLKGDRADGYDAIQNDVSLDQRITGEVPPRMATVPDRHEGVYGMGEVPRYLQGRQP